MRRSMLVLGLFAVMAPLASADVRGVWLTQSGNGHIEIASCDTASVCGTIVPGNAQSLAAKDTNNPDPKLATRPLVGLKMLWGFQAKGEAWQGGRIYNPEDGRTYGAKLKLKDANTLEVSGCVGPICRKQLWTRVVTPKK